MFAIPRKLICGGTGGVDPEVPEEDCAPVELVPLEPFEDVEPEAPMDEAPAPPPEVVAPFTVIDGAFAKASWFPLPSRT